MLALSVLAWLLTLRYIYRVGRTWNDHAVAVVVSACFAVQSFGVGGALGVMNAWAMLSLFWAVSQPHGVPQAVWWGVGTLSAWAYGASLWALASWPLWAFELWTRRLPRWWVPAAVLAAWHVTWTVVRRNQVRTHPVPGLPLRIVQLSDIHVHGLQNRRELDALVARTNALAPDLVLLTGDHLTPFSEADPSPLFAALAGLQAPAFACMGNHDLPVKDAVIAGFAALGRPVLVDARAMHDGVEIVGIDFRWTGLDTHVSELLAALPPVPARFRILMAHDPRVARHVPEGRFDLILSGHTHGGQVSLQSFGLRGSFVSLAGGRDHGWFGATTRHYVHAGNWVFGLPPRLGVAPEIVLLTPGARPTEQSTG